MSVSRLLERAVGCSVRLLLAGGDVTALEEAAGRLTAAGVRDVAVVGSGAMRAEGHQRLASVASLLRTREPNRVRDGIDALDLAADPVRFATGLAALGDADALVTGPGIRPEELMAAVAWTFGAVPDGGPVHSANWILLEDGSLVAFADCARTGELPPMERARLARAVAETHGRLDGQTPRVVFLAGPHELGEDGAAVQAVSRLKALDPGIMAEASPTLRFRDRSNVFIFPGGTAGHLAAHSVRALAGARLLGPLLLGPPGVLAGVAEDADVDELVGTAALAVIAAGGAGT